jgi:hypothetical protein
VICRQEFLLGIQQDQPPTRGSKELMALIACILAQGGGNTTGGNATGGNNSSTNSCSKLCWNSTTCTPETPSVEMFNHKILVVDPRVAADKDKLLNSWSGSAYSNGVLTKVRLQTAIAFAQLEGGVIPAGLWTKETVQNPCGCLKGRSWWNHESCGELIWMDDGRSATHFHRAPLVTIPRRRRVQSDGPKEIAKF